MLCVETTLSSTQAKKRMRLWAEAAPHLHRVPVSIPGYLKWVTTRRHTNLKLQQDGTSASLLLPKAEGSWTGSLSPRLLLQVCCGKPHLRRAALQLLGSTISSI